MLTAPQPGSIRKAQQPKANGPNPCRYVAGEANAAHQHSSEIPLKQALCVLPHPEMLKYDKLLPEVFSFALDQLLISAHRFFLILVWFFSTFSLDLCLTGPVRLFPGQWLGQ